MELSKEQAIELFESRFWEKMTKQEIAEFQLFEPRLCVPFHVFHEAIESALGRPVFTHEFAGDRIKEEFLGDREPPTFEQIMDLIPEYKRINVRIPDSRWKL